MYQKMLGADVAIADFFLKKKKNLSTSVANADFIFYKREQSQHPLTCIKNTTGADSAIYE